MPRRLLMIYTGGTLGMQPSAQGLIPGTQIARRLSRQLAMLPLARQKALPEWTLIEEDTPLDSSSCTPLDWQRLAKDVRHHASQHNTDGIVILHGTDTMAWCCAVLSLWLADIATELPVIVTGAQQPLEAEGSDACQNIELALRYAACPGSQGVMLAFGDHLLQGDAVRKWHTERHAGFLSPNAEPLACWPAIERSTAALPLALPPRPNVDVLRLTAALSLCAPSLIPAHQLPRLARVVLWPGITADQLDALLSTADVATLEVWGNGNFPADPQLQQSVSNAAHRGLRMIVISQCPYGSTHIGHYAAGQVLKTPGIFEGGTLTPEMAAALLLSLAPVDSIAQIDHCVPSQAPQPLHCGEAQP